MEDVEVFAIQPAFENERVNSCWLPISIWSADQREANAEISGIFY